MRLLDGLDAVAVVHQSGGAGWEPFDAHNCGPLPTRDLRRCLDCLFSRPPDLAEANRIYTRTATRPLELPPGAEAVGFKMRFRPPRRSGGLGRLHFERTLLRTFARHGVVALLAVRQDVLRWALSKYHGDGSGAPGHLQFALARGEISRSEIPSLRVDCERLERLISECEASHRRKRRLLARLARWGIRAHPILYERFVGDRAGFLRELLGHLGLRLPEGEIEAALRLGTHFEKVHSDDISDFVENHREVMERFGQRYVAW